jgi:cytochrome P450
MVSQQTAAGPRRSEADVLLAQWAAPGGSEDPYPLYAKLRALAPVHLGESGGVYLSRYDDCAAVIRDPSLGAQSPAWMDQVRPGWREHPGLRLTHESFLFRDPPDHTRLRRMVSGAFTQRKADALRGHVTTLVTRALDLVAGAGSAGGTVDLHEVLATSLPIWAVSHVLGVPEEDFPLLREPLEGLRLAADGRSATADLTVIDQAAVALLDYFASLAAQRRRAPRDDLISALVAIRDDAAMGGPRSAGPVLTGAEMLQSITLIFSAAIESMVDLLLNGTRALLLHPAQADLLRADPGLAPGVVEEVLRYDPPVQAMGRIPGTAMRVGGMEVPAGTRLLIMLGAANRDPGRFPAPDDFDIRRQGPPVLSFGGGAHFCLGAALARLQAALFFPALLTRFPGLALAGPPVRRGLVLRGFATFPVTLG